MKILFIDIHTDPEIQGQLFPDDSIFSVNHVRNTVSASEHIQLYEYDCILLQCRELTNETENLLTEIHAKNQQAGLVIASQVLSVKEKVRLLNAGADDCLAIPYEAEELRARMLAIIRRKKFNTSNSIHIANVVIDIAAQSICVWDIPMILTRTEYDLFLFLIMNRSTTLSQAKLADYLWGDAAEEKETSNLLITHIRNLRKKLKQAKAELEIKNLYAIGYTLIEL